MIKRTRYKISIITALYLIIMATLSVFKNMEGVAISSIAGIMTILSSYVWGETKRPSENSEKENQKESD